VVAPGVRDVEAVMVLADRIVRALDLPVPIEGHQVRTPASIGIAMSHAGIDPDDLLQRADAAMYVAKGQGGGRYHMADDPRRQKGVSDPSLILIG
jgi:GGDEF domain-containing protein